MPDFKRFNPADYETVKQRKDRFRGDYPEGVILPVLLTDPANLNKEAAFIVGIWRDGKVLREMIDSTRTAESDPRLVLLLLGPDAIGTAYENSGMTGASRTSWTENAEESAIGRALDNLKYHGGGRCSREEILKAKEVEGLQDEGARPANEPPGAPEPDPIRGGNAPDYSSIAMPIKASKNYATAQAILGVATVLGWSADKVETWVEARIGGKHLNEASLVQMTALLQAIKALAEPEPAGAKKA